jgi:hypothetical protein
VFSTTGDIREIATQMVVMYIQTEIETDGSPAAEAKARPRRRVSEAGWAANSVNAARSTGSTSTAGKARAALNAVSHGTTSNTIIFFKDELPNEFYAQVNRWAVQLGAVTDAEYACSECGCDIHTRW